MNDNHRHTTPPIITRLRRAGRQADLANLVAYDQPPQADLYHDNDNRRPDMGVDAVLQIRPTENEIARACMKSDEHGIGLRFDAKGAITHWRRADAAGNPVLDRRGREQWFEAFERYAQPKGRRRKTRAEQAEDAAAYLAIPSTGAFTPPSTYVERGSEGEDYRRQRATRWVEAMGCYCDQRRQELDRLGVGGRSSFDEAWANAGLYPACRLPQFRIGVAAGISWLAGRVRKSATATAGSFVGAVDAAENALAAAMDRPALVAGLGEHADVLQDSLAGKTARQLAAKRGWGTSKAAEQRAVRAQDRALAALAEAQEQAA
jgi:hypothetical protein